MTDTHRSWTAVFRTVALLTGALLIIAIVALALNIALGFPDASDRHGWVGPAFYLAAAAGVVPAVTIAVGTVLAPRTRGFTAVATIAFHASLASTGALVGTVAGRPVLDWLYGVVGLAWVPLWVWAAKFSRQAATESV